MVIKQAGERVTKVSKKSELRSNGEWFADHERETGQGYQSEPLNGEWAGGPTARGILLEVGLKLETLSNEEVDDLLDAWEEGYEASWNRAEMKEVA